MMMTYFLHTDIETDETFDHINHSFNRSKDSSKPDSEEFHILREKFKIPATDNFIDRARINSLLRKSVDQFPATLISGRAGTGKTAVAAAFAAKMENASWFSVEPTDIEWAAFSRYFKASLSKNSAASRSIFHSSQQKKSVSEAEIAHFLETCFLNAGAKSRIGKSLIVLDDIHHIFNAVWFDDFFYQLLYSLPSTIHVLFLCRSSPVTPLWRLRSKQMLNVIDEKIIAFDANETKSLFDTLNLSAADAKRAHYHYFGRISKILEFAANLQ